LTFAPLPLYEAKQTIAEALKSKRRPLDGWSPLVPFLVCFFVVLPVWLVILLPSTIAWQVVKYALKAIGLVGSGKLPPPVFFDRANQIELGEDDEKVPSKKTRDFDLIIYGATGFTGKLAEQYMARRYGHSGSKRGGVKWAIAGRSKSKLATVQAELNAIIAAEEKKAGQGGEGDVPVVVADSQDFKSLQIMARRTRVVASAVGPFSKYGSLLVGACAESGN
jgi:hypothetical protein